MKLPKAQRGVALAAPMAVGSGFSLAVALAAFGATGVTRVVLFNAINNPLLFIWVYSIAAAYNPQTVQTRDIARRVVASPALWALVLGVACNLLHVHIHTAITGALLDIGNLTSVVVILGLGLLFAPQRVHLKLALYISLLRTGVGLAIGVLVVTLLRMHGVDAAVILLLAAAPVGFNMITFASIEKLDDELAASAVSYSLAIGLLVAPLILFLVQG